MDNPTGMPVGVFDEEESDDGDTIINSSNNNNNKRSNSYKKKTSEWDSIRGDLARKEKEVDLERKGASGPRAKGLTPKSNSQGGMYRSAANGTF